MPPRLRLTTTSFLLVFPALFCDPPSPPAHAQAHFVEPNRPSCALYHTRRQRAEHVLIIANAVEPVETAAALRLARSRMRSSPLNQMEPEERTFLRHTIKEGIARGVACAAGGAVASYAILKLVLLVIPLVPSPHVTRVAMSVVSFGAAVAELAAVPDLATIELLLMTNSQLGIRARATIEQHNPHLLLLQTLDRHTLHLEQPQSCAASDFELHHASDFLDVHHNQFR
ncbi:unnamed protein product [Agarophyton chilense]